MKALLLIALLATLPICGMTKYPPLADGTTELQRAIRANDTEWALGMLKRPYQVDATNRYGITALSLACENGNAAIVKALLDAGADANTRQRGGETVLMIAARTGDKKCVEALL